jgi:3,4-dihydroxy 2-butanone 4-phosphate synthase/GTP cyclohydrolase II
LLNQDSRRPLVIAAPGHDEVRREAIEATGAEVVTIQRNSRNLVDLDAMLNNLGKLGFKSLMVEGGSGIITNFLLEKLADYIVLTVAPVMVGGLRAVKELGLPLPENLPRVVNPQHRWLGEDLILWGDLV